MPKKEPVCDHNCFECKLPDCICCDMATSEETGIIRYWSTGYDHRTGISVPEKSPKRAEKKSKSLAYYYANKERILQQQREYRERKREERKHK